MTKQDLVSAIAERSGLSKKDSTLFLETCVEVITDTTATGEKVLVAGLGTFARRDKKGSEGVIHFGSRKGEKWATEDSYKVGFTASKGFIEKVRA